MSYSESELYSNFAINWVSDFNSASESNSEFSSPCIYSLLNKPVDSLLSILITESIVTQAMQV